MLLLAIILGFGLLGVALFGERFAPNEDIYFVVEHGKDPRPFDPGVVFPLGSDVLGRDLFSLVLAGAGTTLTIVVLAGLARVVAGIMVAALGGWWRPARLLTESLAQLVSAIPATVLALVLVKVFVKTDTTILVFIGALLLIGWAGPYRVIRAELDRVARAPFTEGARAIGVGRWRLLWRHQLPHLVPVIAINFTQQVIAALVLVAELGVIGILVGPTRRIDIAESVGRYRLDAQYAAAVQDLPEWGGLLAGSRTIEALYVTRWLILVPGVAFALAALAVAAVGYALARRYARSDVVSDLRSRGMAVITLGIAGLFVVSALVPERYAEARELAAAARSEVRPASESLSAFVDAGLETMTVGREVVNVERTAPASVQVGANKVAEDWPIPPNPAVNTLRIRSVVSAEIGGGGIVEAPLVFAARGISPAQHPRRPRPFGLPPGEHFSEFIQDYPDDYAGIDVRGKVVLLLRFLGITRYPPGSRFIGVTPGPTFNWQIADAIERGAAAVIYVDPALGYYTEAELPYTTALGLIRGGINPYSRLEREAPAVSAEGVPVIVIHPEEASSLVRPFGIDFGPLLSYDQRSTEWEASASRDVGVAARVQVSAAREARTVTSYVGAVPNVPEGAGWVAVWAPRRAEDPGAADVLAGLGRTLGGRGLPFVLVDFDPAADRRESIRQIAVALRGKRVDLVVVLDGTRGDRLTVTTPYGDLIPAFDLYAEKASARFETTRNTATLDSLAGLAPFVQTKTVVLRGEGDQGDLRGDAAALIGYLAGRLALGAPELPR